LADPEGKMFAKILISVLALGLAALHIIVPSFQIDAITIVAVGIALLPWLSTLFKSVEIPGWLKVEFKYFQKAAKDAESAGLLSGPLTTKERNQYSFQLIATDDPNLALAGLRIEIEKRLKKLAQRNGIGTEYQGIGNMLRNLGNGNALTDREVDAIDGILELLNNAVHGARVDAKTANWVLDFGPRILKSLDQRMDPNEPKGVRRRVRPGSAAAKTQEIPKPVVPRPAGRRLPER
jgi:hypothetical protein